MHGDDLDELEREHAKLNLLRFTALNALSFEVLAGQILILFARQAGASLGDIGLLSALLPFAAVIQLVVAPLVNRFGPRRVMLAGWGARTFVSAGLFLVPVAMARGGPAAGTQLLLVVMLGFYICRALGMSSWLPLVQEIVRPHDRGIYLSRQEWLRQASIVLINVITALYLIDTEGMTRFLHVIGLGVVAAAWSLVYLARVPDVGSMAEPLDREYLSRATAPLRDAIFRRFLLFSVLLRMALSAVPPFLVVFLRDGLNISASGVIAINTIGSLGAIATLVAWGRWTDRIGARPVLGLVIAGIAGSLALWLLTDTSAVWLWLGVPLISLLIGIFTGGLTVSMSKFELGFIPVLHRAHYVALSVTLTGLGSGAATLASGYLLQVLRGVNVQWGLLEIDRFRIFFLVMAVLLIVSMIPLHYLPEEHTRSLRAIVKRVIARRTLRMRRLLATFGGNNDG
ncbi:MAG: MFS transporter [Armatimonadota bacterium]